MSGSLIVTLYAKHVIEGKRTLDSVPISIRKEVEAVMELANENVDLTKEKMSRSKHFN